MTGGSLRATFRRPGFALLFAGTTTSMFGDSVMLLVLSMWVKDLTGSNAQAGLTFFWMVLPSLVAPLLGGPIDRVRRKPLLVWGNLASALMVLPLLTVHDAGDVWVVWAVAVLYGFSFVVLPAGLNGLLKELLPEDLLVDANASMQTVKESFRLVGPLIGAGLYALTGGWGVVLVDALSFAVAAACIARIGLVEARPVHEAQHWVIEMTAGIRHLVHDEVLKHVMVAFGLMLLTLGFAEASIYAILDAFGKPVEWAGIVVTVQGVGAVVGGLTSSRVIRRTGEPTAIAVALTLMASSFVVVVVARSIWLMLGGVVVLGYSLPLLFVAYTTLVQLRTPQAIMGRVSTALEVVLGTPQAISLAVGSLLVSLVSFRVIFAIMALTTGAGAAYLFARSPRRLLVTAPEPEAD
ncbi:MAG: MFS transporter [Nocardioidaceae bacterium]